ncbi:hypothetical protein IE53DRAFT_201261 [Violaceomyces palustris]|uniref:Uncharacterized protein n=1 Tax=Violaceomyces palustris TaxID=1673888 RepID=A0ACD0P5F1_9BASI|nr:hypothetical protein IE53DRAFT_201261 [Violaceomyces palustris]
MNVHPCIHAESLFPSHVIFLPPPPPTPFFSLFPPFCFSVDTEVFSQHSVSMAPHPSSHLKNAVKGAAFALSELTKAWTLILDDLLQLYNEMLVQLADAVVQLEQSTRPLRKKADIEFKSFGERLKINGKEALIMGRKLGGEALVLGQKLGEDASVIGQKLERSTRPLLEMADRETKMLGEKLKSGGKEALVIGQRLHEDAFSFSQKLGENGKEAICRGRKVAESALGETKKRAYKASKNARKIVDRLYDCKHAKGKKKTKRAAMDEPMSHAKKMWGRAMRAADDRLEYWFFPDEL